LAVRVVVGDLFESQAQTLVNTVNCVGVMGRGIALGFRKRFPAMFKDYVDRCNAGEVELGKPYLHQTLLPPWVLNFPTKDHWRGVARLEDIIAGLDHLQAHYETWGITSLAVPPLGCGEGQLEWRIVGSELFRRLSALEIPVELYAPYGTPSAELEEAFLTSAVPPMTSDQSEEGTRRIPAAWFALAAIVERLDQLSGGHGVGRTLFQGAAYFATADGVPTRLTFGAGSYGPFAPSLKQVTSKLVNNGVLAEERDGRSIKVRPGRSYTDAERVFAGRSIPWETSIDRVAALLGGRTIREAEVLAMVLYAWRTADVGTGTPPSREAVLEFAGEWQEKRKQPFRPGEVEDALQTLIDRAWIVDERRTRSGNG
jgi:O-acetyl-ADP-ribose deacetylase (regulator of RNase III)